MTVAQFSDAFSDAFATGATGNLQYATTDPYVVNATGAPGALWVDTTQLPHPLWAWNDGEHRWVPVGVFVTDALTGSSARIWRATLLRAGRWWLITKAPLGILEGDLGSIYVSRFDTESNDLLRGFRGLGVPVGQVWPTLEEVATELMNTSSSKLPQPKRDALQQALDSAIEWVLEETQGAWL